MVDAYFYESSEHSTTKSRWCFPHPLAIPLSYEVPSVMLLLHRVFVKPILNKDIRKATG